MLFTETERHPMFSSLLDRATRLLAQRDHSVEELKEKIRLSVWRSQQRDAVEQTAIDETALASVIAWCEENGWLDDQRFTRLFIQSRGRNGYGPQRVRQDLQHKGVERELINQELAETDIDWQQQAENVARKKYGHKWPTEAREKARLQRFLHSRGFLMEDIRSVLVNFSG
ncbi:regulatory protein RecX [Tatumella morbirosei]|nr:regulatory protein RecX [Tatumella morbirosei]